jgi:hypothetical protein
MDMNIAALSVDMHLAQTQQDFGVAVMKMAINDSAEQTEEVLQEIGNLDPNVGNNIDIMA